MNSKEKLYAMKNGNYREGTLFFPIVMHFAARLAGQKYSDFAKDYREMVKANITCMDQIGMDYVTVMCDAYRETSAFGGVVSYPEDAVPRCTTQDLSEIEDLEQLKKPDISTSGRIKNCLDSIREYKQKLNNQVPIVGWVEGPLAEACDIIGMEKMMLSTYMNPEFAGTLMRKCLTFAKQFAKAQIDAGADVIGIGEAVCSQISVEQYAEMIFTLDKELIDFIHENGALVKLHICGNITHLLSLIREAHPDIIDIDSMVDMDIAYNLLGPEIIRCGNLDPVKMCREWNASEVYQFSKSLIKKEVGRPFILSAGCEIPVGTPLDNLLAMKRAALETVRY
jgi:MtaA/CmuA family methyltransferase